MATPEQIIQLRLDLGGLTEAQLPGPQAATIIDKIAAQYPSGSPAVIEAAQWVRYLEGKAESLREETSYTQNQESVDKSDAFKATLLLLARWEKKLAAALDDDGDPTTAPTPPPSGTVRLKAVW